MEASFHQGVRDADIGPSGGFDGGSVSEPERQWSPNRDTTDEGGDGSEAGQVQGTIRGVW